MPHDDDPRDGRPSSSDPLLAIDPALPAEPPRPTMDPEARRAFFGRPEVYEALGGSFSAVDQNRKEILHDGLRDVLESDRCPADEADALAFAKRKVENARQRYYYRIRRRSGKEAVWAEMRTLSAPERSPPGEMERAGEVAEELAAKNPADGRALAMMRMRYLQEQSVAQVAEAFGTTVDAVYQTESRFTRRVRAAMLLVVAILAWFFWREYRKPQHVDTGGHVVPTPSATPSPDVPVAPPSPAPPPPDEPKRPEKGP